MSQPYTNEPYVGTPQGAWRNRLPLAVRRCGDLSSAILMCTTPEMFTTNIRRAAFESVASKAKLVRSGEDCYAYCMLASGYVDVNIEAEKPYDVQALIPIIEGAGGVITTWDGQSAQNGGAIVACGDPALHKQLVDKLKHAA